MTAHIQLLHLPKTGALPKTGNHFAIRRLEERDLDDLYTLVSDPELKRFMGGPVPQPREQWIAEEKSDLSSSEPSNRRLSIEMDGCLAGYARLGSKEWGSKDLQILLAKPYQLQGLGTAVSKILISAAFNELRAPCVYAVVDPQNQDCIKLVRKLGFELEREVSDTNSWQYGHKIFALVSQTHQVPI